MIRSNSHAFEVALGWTAVHMGAADWATLHSHSEIRTKPYFARSTVPPIRRDLELCGCCHGAANLRGRELASDSNTGLKCATSSARSIWLTYDKVASRSTPVSALLSEDAVEHLSGHRVHHLVATNVVLDSDLRVCVPEQLRGEIDTGLFVDRGRDRAAEHVRGDPSDPREVEHVAQLAAHVVRRERRPLPAAEEQCIR